MRFAAAVGASLVAGIAATAWTALTLAEFGHYTPFAPIVAFPAAALLVFFLLDRGRAAGEPRRLAPEDLLAVGIAVATLLICLPADEIIVGGQDPGVYIHTAAAIARKGSLVIDEPDLAAFTDEAERGLLFRNYAGISLPFPGMWTLPDGRVSPQFYHLYPSLMAVAWSIGGARAALLVNPLLNVAAVLALYAVATMLLGRRWALAATVLHALATAQVRQAKFPTAEMMMQLFILAGVALLAQATREDSPTPAAAPLAGVSFGMAILTRYDSVLFLLPLAAVLFWGMGPAHRTRPVLVTLGTTAVFFTQSQLHQRYITPYYLPLGGFVGPVFLAAALLLSALLLARRTGPWRRVVAGAPRLETALRAGAALLLVAWVLFGWFVRPRLAGAGCVGHLFRLVAGDPPASAWAALLSGVESQNMLYLVDLLGAVGLLAATAGIAFLVVSRRQIWESAWLTASCAMLAAVTLNIYHDHFLMWASRRFVPVVIPLTSVGVAAAAAFVARARVGRTPVRAGAGVALVAVVLGLTAGDTRAMASEREWPGLIAWYERFEKNLPADAEIYCDQPGFAAPLRFISGHRAYELPARNPERIGRLVALMRRRAAAGRQVLYLSQQTFGDLQTGGMVPLGSYPLRSSMLTSSRRGVPRGTKERTADFVLYRMQPS